MGVSYLTVGNFNIDNTVSADGVISLQQLGGNAVYSVIGAHIWSRDVGVTSVIPENYPQSWLDEMEKVGINLNGVQRAAPPVDLEEWFFYHPDGSRIDHIYAPHHLFVEYKNRRTPLQAKEIVGVLETVRNFPQQGGVSFGEFRRINPLGPEHIPQGCLAIHGCHLAPNSYASHLSLAAIFPGTRRFYFLGSWRLCKPGV